MEAETASVYPVRERPQKGMAETPVSVVVREAHINDVEAILTLINNYASMGMMLSRGPKYVYENIRNFVVGEAVMADGSKEVVACASLNVLWQNMGEIRSLAVQMEFQGLGLGTRIVQALIASAEKIGIKRLFVFTMHKDFFYLFGFKPRPREALPSKLWSECYLCPKYFKCDETGLVLDF